MKISAVITLLLLVTSCSIIKEKWLLKKAHQQGVPKTSVWVGGQDGGEWVNFTFFKDSLFVIDTYNDYTNELNNSYQFKITCPYIKEKDIKKAFDFTNGIYVVWKKESEVSQCVEIISKLND